jgi:ABC-type multidrug transport system permease subunit
MSRWKAFGQMVLARLRIFFREPAALFWVYCFPIVMAVGLAIAFWNRPPEAPAVDVVASGSIGAAEEFADELRRHNVTAKVVDEADALHRYRTGKTALFVTLQGKELTFGLDPTRSESVAARYQVEAIARRWKSPDAITDKERLETEPGNRYIDFLIPGLMGMNLVGGGLWGIGFVVTDLRVRKFLKRLIATPMRRGDFLLSLLSARLIMIVPEMLSLYLVGRLLFGVPMRGCLGTLALIMITGALAACGIGLLVASRTEKSETVVGLINLIILPMWLLSGVFFSSKKYPDAAQPFIQALPMTQINDALREVMLEGKSLTDVAWRIGILAAYAIVTFVVALRLFKWR